MRAKALRLERASSIPGKLLVDNRTEAAVWAVREGFIEQDKA